MHGGVNELLPPGDPGRGGAPCKTFRYSKFLKSDEDRDIYESAHSATGTLDPEIALTRTNLARFQRKVEEAEKSGIPTSVGDGGRSISIESYAAIVFKYLDLVGKLEERRARMLEAGIAGAANDSTAVRWEIRKADEITLEQAVAESRGDPDSAASAPVDVPGGGGPGGGDAAE